ncbi:LOW QUALITY PROTEIN: HERV-H LTR-associating protein 2 [Glossophaga mutica]
MSEQILLGSLDEDIILPCLFESGPKVIIHWRNQDNVYTYYKDSDYLKQDPRHKQRMLFHHEIHSGNASISLRRLSLLDEGTYMCFITQKVDNAPISASTLEEIESFDPLYNGRVNITGSNLSNECAIENLMLKQTWTERWTMKDRFPGAVCVYVLGQSGQENGTDLQEKKGTEKKENASMAVGRPGLESQV